MSAELPDVAEWTVAHRDGHVTCIEADPHDGTHYEFLIIAAGHCAGAVPDDCCLVVVLSPHQAAAPIRSDVAWALDENYVMEKLCPAGAIWSARVLTLLLGHHLGRMVSIDERWLSTCDL